MVAPILSQEELIPVLSEPYWLPSPTGADRTPVRKVLTLLVWLGASPKSHSLTTEQDVTPGYTEDQPGLQNSGL